MTKFLSVYPTELLAATGWYSTYVKQVKSETKYSLTAPFRTISSHSSEQWASEASFPTAMERHMRIGRLSKTTLVAMTYSYALKEREAKLADFTRFF
jgi:hypothetical protein